MHRSLSQQEQQRGLDEALDACPDEPAISDSPPATGDTPACMHVTSISQRPVDHVRRLSQLREPAGYSAPGTGLPQSGRLARAARVRYLRASSTSASNSRLSSPSSGCQRTPTAKRRAGSSTTSTVPSCATPAATRPVPTVLDALVVGRLHARARPEHAGGDAPGIELDVVLGEGAELLAMPLVADQLRQMLVQTAAAEDVQHLHPAADPEHRHVAGERCLEQRELGRVALRLGDRLLVDAPAPYRSGSMSAPPERMRPSMASSVSSTASAAGGMIRRPAAGALDRLHVRERDERGRKHPGTPAGLLGVRRDSDERPHPGEYTSRVLRGRLAVMRGCRWRARPCSRRRRPPSSTARGRP